MAGNRSASWTNEGGVKPDGTLVRASDQYRIGGLGPGRRRCSRMACTKPASLTARSALHTNEDSAIAMRAPGIHRLHSRWSPC